MKKMIALMALCLLLTGCKSAQEGTAAPAETAAPQAAQTATEAAAPALEVKPLADTTMDNLTDAILSVSLEEGDAYVDDTGVMRMDLKIYSYDRYDMVDIAQLKVGDTIVRHEGAVEITSLERTENGSVLINGGLDNGGFDLVTFEEGVFFEMGYNDVKNWHEVGEATIRVSTEFEMIDNGDPAAGEVMHFPGSFLIGEITDYNFTPYNTTIRVEEGQIVFMERIYTP